MRIPDEHGHRVISPTSRVGAVCHHHGFVGTSSRFCLARAAAGRIRNRITGAGWDAPTVTPAGGATGYGHHVRRGGRSAEQRRAGCRHRDGLQSLRRAQGELHPNSRLRSLRINTGHGKEHSVDPLRE